MTLTVYDIRTDSRRPITQAEVDYLQQLSQIQSGLLRELRARLTEYDGKIAQAVQDYNKAAGNR